MKRVFAKEWLQGQMIAMFGLLLGGLITALWGILTVAYVRDWTDQEAVNGFCGVMYYLVPLVLAAFVGSGLFAAEVDRGTMTLLLALPFSRTQVWIGKTLAGLALMLCAVVLVLVPAVIAVRPALAEVEFWKLLPETVLATTLLYIAALFWSTVLTTITSALLSAAALVLGLVAIAFLIVAFGGRLFGPPLLDIELWALAAAPGLLAGSYFGFVRGETFRGKRRWVLPLVTAGALYLIIGSAYLVLARWGTRYERSLVKNVEWAQVTGDGEMVSMLTYASPVELTREVEKKLARGDGGYRRVYSVCVDLKTGKELLARREASIPQVSPDGKYAFLFTEPRALTWRGHSTWDYNTGSILEIWELAGPRMIYRGVPRRPGKDQSALQVNHAEWSPDSRWIVLSASAGYDEGDIVLLMRPDGTVQFEIDVFERYGERASWVYAPNGDVLYVVSHAGALMRIAPGSKRAKTIWNIGELGLKPDKWLMRIKDITISPQGDLIALACFAILPPANERKEFFVVMKSDGSQTQVIPDISPQEFAWSRDGKTLFIVVYTKYENRRGEMEVAAWREGKFNYFGLLPTRGGWPEMLPFADGRMGLFLGDNAWIVDDKAKITPVTKALKAALAGSRVAGLDAQGRIIVRRPEGYLAAIAVDTGQVARIYP